MIKQIIEDDKTRHRNNAIQGQKYLRHLKEGFSGGYNTVMDYLRKEYRKQRKLSCHWSSSWEHMQK